MTRARATCLCCGTVLPPERVRAQLAAERGGADVVFDEEGRRIGGARLTAVVTLRPGASGRHYRLPTQADYAAVRRAQGRIARVLAEWERGGRHGLCPVPDEPTPATAIRGRVGRSACNATACSSGATCSRRGRRRRWSERSDCSRLVPSTKRHRATLLAMSRKPLVATTIVQVLGGLTGRIRNKVRHLFARQARPYAMGLRRASFCRRDSSGSFEATTLTGMARVVNRFSESRSRRQIHVSRLTPPNTPSGSNGRRLVYRSAVLRRGSLRRPLRLLPRLAQARTARLSRCCAIRSIKITPSHPRRLRRCKTKPSRSPDGPRIACGSRRQWPARSQRGAACYAKTASARSCSHTRPPRAGRRCYRA